jgi:hypothetical protein
MRKLALLGVALLLSGTAMAADFTGSWKLNLEKSTGNLASFVSYTLKIEQIAPNTYRTTTDIVRNQGGELKQVIDRTYDGQEHHVPINGTPEEGTQICEFTATGERKITMKEDGKVVEVLHSSVSSDGKTLTNRITTDKGETVMVFDRQ